MGKLSKGRGIERGEAGPPPSNVACREGLVLPPCVRVSRDEGGGSVGGGLPTCSGLWSIVALWELLGYDPESLSSMRANALLAKICSSPSGHPSAYPHLLLVGSGTICEDQVAKGAI